MLILKQQANYLKINHIIKIYGIINKQNKENHEREKSTSVMLFPKNEINNSLENRALRDLAINL